VSDFNDDQDRLVGRVARSAFANLTDSIIDVHSAVKVLAVTVTAEIVAFAMYYVSKDKVLEFMSDERNGSFWLYASIAIFLIGFLTAFSIYRLISNKWRHAGAHIYFWLVSFAAGASNLLLFFGLTSFDMR
jgi:hypothetical protein